MPDKENKGPNPVESPDPPGALEPSGFRAYEPDPQLIRKAEVAAKGAGRKIAGNFPDLPRRDQLRLIRAFRGQIIHRKRPGRKKKAQITAAHLDWKASMCGVELHRKHIPGWDNFGQWRRKGEVRRLMDAIRSRHRREVTQSSNLAIARSAPQVTPKKSTVTMRDPELSEKPR